MTMSSISSARLWVHLYDVNGSEIYKSTGVTRCKWSQNHITAPGIGNYGERAHKNAIVLANGDRMMIIGKDGLENNSNFTMTHGRGLSNCYNAYRSYNIIITHKTEPNSCYDQTWDRYRRMIIAVSTVVQG